MVLMKKSLSDLLCKYPFLKIIADGKLGEKLGDSKIGFYGECFDFALAIQEIIGGKFACTMSYNNIDHVLVEIDDKYLIDAKGIYPKDSWSIDAYKDKSEIERYIDSSKYLAIACALEMFDVPNFKKWKICAVNEKCPCDEKKKAQLKWMKNLN